MKFRKILSMILSASMLSAFMIATAHAQELIGITADGKDLKPDGENGVVIEETVPDGDYTVTVTTGGDTETKANIYINGGERVRAYTLEAGKTQEDKMPAVPKDGKITVQVKGENPNVKEIKIEQLENRTEKGEKPTIYIAGDSTAQTYNYEKVYPQTGWGQVFDRFFTNDVIVENRSMGGRSSKSYNNDGRLDRILTEMHPGDYVFIQFGINDGAENKPERYISVEDYKTLIKDKYIGEVIKRGGIPVLMTASAAAWWDEENNKFMESRQDYADPTRELAKETGVAFIDANRIMTDAWNSMDKDDVLSGYFICEPLESKAYPVGTNDTTHMKEKGAVRVAKLIAEAIPECVPELAPYLKGEEKFDDISGHWAEADIKNITVVGDGSGKFRPERLVTRAEFLKMAMDTCGIAGHAYRWIEQEGYLPYSESGLDIRPSDWYCNYLQGALDKGLIPYQMMGECTGKEKITKVIEEATEDKEAVTTEIYDYKKVELSPMVSRTPKFSFGGDNIITREEMAAILNGVYNYYINKDIDTKEICGTNHWGKEFIIMSSGTGKTTGTTIEWFTDVYGSEYTDSIINCYFYGLIKGMDNKTFAPKDTLTRAQAAAVINRLANLLK